LSLRRLFRLESQHDCFSAPLSINKPIAAAVDGHAIAGGFVLASACDFVAVSNDETIKLGITGINSGLPYPRGAIEVLRQHLGQGRAFRHFLYTGNLHSPQEAFELGWGDSIGQDPEASAIEWLQHKQQLAEGLFSSVKRQIHYPFHQQIGEHSAGWMGTLSKEEQLAQITPVSFCFCCVFSCFFFQLMFDGIHELLKSKKS
jgi:enoyl-CoA hydratase